LKIYNRNIRYIPLITVFSHGSTQRDLFPLSQPLPPGERWGKEWVLPWRKGQGGALVRTHGGCVMTEQAVHESEYHSRVSVNYNLKQAIGVYTNSIAMIDELSRHSGVDIYLLGGKYSRRQHCLGGSITEQILRGPSFDIVFMGADSIDENGRVLVMNPEEAEMDRLMLKSGRRKILLADNTKMKSDGRAVYGMVSDFDLMISTDGIPADQLIRFREMTEVIMAE
jgi:DeoR/GlpR family transcriptional regulator of sugar metabolism